MFNQIQVLVFPRETAIKFLIRICLNVPWRLVYIYRHLHNGTLLRKLPSELRDVRGEKLQGVSGFLIFLQFIVGAITTYDNDIGLP